MPRWVENRNATHAKIREVLLSWEPRQKLRIIPDGEKDFSQRSLLPSYERHLNHWGSSPRSSPLGYHSLAYKLPCTSEGPHNMSFEPGNNLQDKQKVRRNYECSLSPSGRAELEKYSKTSNVELAKNTPPICHGNRDTQHNLQQRRKILTHGRENEIIDLRFTHDGTKLFNSGA